MTDHKVRVYWARGLRGGPDQFEVFCETCERTITVATDRTKAATEAEDHRWSFRQVTRGAS